ncbi:MAG: threonine--tRNA ligase [Candidatus Micrarchaeota archaeon]
MKLLLIHSDFIEYEPLSKALKSAEETEKGKRRVEECLVALMSIEEGDEPAEEVASSAAKEIESVARQVKTNRIVLYPWVHLSQTPSSPQLGMQVMKKLGLIMKEKTEFEITRSPFGWYKSFDLKCKGHPLSELSRDIRPGKAGEKKDEERVSESLKKEKESKSEFFVLTPDGELVPCDSYKYKDNKNLKKFIQYEVSKVRAYNKEPPHIKLMKSQGIADYEPGSDSGNFRWYPKGRLIKKILERDISEYCISYGAMEVETPVMYDFEHPALKAYMNRFPARQYVVKSDKKEYFLRFAACFGQFLMTHDMVFSHKSLPLKMFELTRYSFRREQTGELAGLKRVRALTMPDMHTMCADIEQARQEFNLQYLKSKEWLESLSIPYEAGFRAQKEFFEKNRDWYVSMVKALGKPALIELFDIRYAYFIAKFEFNFIDALDKASALSTVQIDVENADTYDISFVDKDGGKKRPPILHASLSGSIERVIYAILEQQAMRIKEGKRALWPLYLAPTQIRLIPVSEKQTEHCEKLLSELRKHNVRVDLDDRNETLQKKVREAEKEWVPFIAVVGDREIESGNLSVRIRDTGKNEQYSPEQLAERTEGLCKHKPFEQISLPSRLSKRPIV